MKLAYIDSAVYDALVPYGAVKPYGQPDVPADVPAYTPADTPAPVSTPVTSVAVADGVSIIPLVGNVGTSGFGSGKVAAFQFLSPSFRSGHVYQVSLSESGGQAVLRDAVLSKVAGSFDDIISRTMATAPTVAFTVGPNNVGLPTLDPNSVYYVNVRNAEQVDGATDLHAKFY